MRVSADRELWVSESARPERWEWCVVSTYMDTLDHDYRSGIEDTADLAKAAAIAGWTRGPLGRRLL